MSNLFKKADVPYLVASSLATLTLISSLVLAVIPRVPFPLILALATLSVLVIALSCKAISSNKRIEVEKNKFAEKEQRLENKISLEKEAGEAANKKVGELKDRLNELMKEKQGLDKIARGLDEKVVRLEAEKDNLSEEKESLEQKLEGKTNRIAELCRMVNEFEKIINAPYKQEKKSHHKQQIKELRYRQMKKLHYAQMKKSLHLKISRLCKQLLEEESNLAKKKEYIAKLRREMSNIMYGEPKNRELDKEKGELRAELDKLQRKIERLTKENKDLSEKLKEMENFLESQFTELEEINKRRNNQVKELKDSLLEKFFERKRCEEALLKKKKEEVVFMQQTIEHVTSKVEESVKGSEKIRGDDKKVILQIIQKIKSVLEEEVAQYLPNEVSYAEFEDRGYDSGRSTPASQLYNTIVKCLDDNRELKEVYDEPNNMRTRYTRFE